MAKTQSPAALAAERANLAKARAAKKGKPLTAKQLASDRANLAKARAAHHGGGGTSRTSTTRGGLKLLSDSKGIKAGAPLGTHRIHAALKHRLTITKPTDTRQRFHHTISGTSSTSRGKWKSARAHHFQHHLKLRKTRGVRLRHWKRRGHRLVPN